MWLLPAIVMLVLFIYLGYIMSRLDRFLEKNARTTDKPVAVVLGISDLAAQVSDLLKKNKIEVFNLTEPFLIERNRDFRYLFALSGNDADNIVLCKTVRKIYGMKNIISICNDQRNKGMYDSEKIYYMLADNVTALMLCRVIIHYLEVGA